MDEERPFDKIFRELEEDLAKISKKAITFLKWFSAVSFFFFVLLVSLTALMESSGQPQYLQSLLTAVIVGLFFGAVSLVSAGDKE